MDLASVLTPEIMAPILANADVQERLLPYLPSGESLPQTADESQNTLTSPQFQQAGWSDELHKLAVTHVPQQALQATLTAQC